MVAKGGSRQSSCNAGELDRLLAGRVDIKQYYAGGLQYANIEPVPQSGFRDMGGTWDVAPVRGRVAVASQIAPSHNFGPHSGTQTVWSCGVDDRIAAVHIDGLSASAGVHDAWIEVQTSFGWQAIGPHIAIGATAKSRTFSLPPGQPASAVGVRLRVAFAETASILLEAVTLVAEGEVQDVPRYASLRHDSGERYFLSLQPQFLDVFQDDEFRAGIWLADVTDTIQPNIGFYAENATIGLFERTMRPVRIRRAGSSTEWTVDDWPLEGIPTVDLGGIYPRTDDKWEVFIRWIENSSDHLYLVLTVDGESTQAVPLRNAADEPVSVGDGAADWTKFAAELQTALADLPSLGPGVTVSVTAMPGRARRVNITFGGNLAGSEYDVTGMVTSTADISALSVHVEVGETEYEPLLSDGRGWPGAIGLVQDRLAYGDILAEPGALALSQAAEYFNLNIQAQAANAARLDRLRAGQTAERILAIKDATYLLVFTDQAVHFAANRTITRTDPLNFTITSETGIVENTEPVDLEGKIFFVGKNDDEEEQDGNQILSLTYDDLMAKFDALPESLLASHLVRRVKRTKRQKSGSDTDASRMWLLRSDGVVLSAQVIRSQEILGLCRWHAALSGSVREIDVDTRNRVRLCVERGGKLRHERLDPQLILHSTIEGACDLSGKVSGLGLHEGREVWVYAEKFVLGPLTVTGGQVDLDRHYTGPVQVGLFQPPVWECMPRWHIKPNDEIVKRPGRIHTAFIDVIETTSIAVGANGQAAENVPLARIGDPAEEATPPASRKLTVSGLLGMKDGTTLVVTQTRPGRLRVRDITIEEKL